MYIDYIQDILNLLFLLIFLFLKIREIIDIILSKKNNFLIKL